MTITSKDNEKLKLVRKLAERKHREREGLFVTEGEDLLEAGRAAGHEPTLLLTRAARAWEATKSTRSSSTRSRPSAQAPA